MPRGKTNLEWCIVRLGSDMNWWVEETSDPVHWDTVDGLSILDPRQVGYVIDLSDPLVEYGFQPSMIDRAFFKFHIVKDLGKGRVKVELVPDSLFGSTEPLFALPDIMDEEKGPYADLVNAVTRTRVKMLNDIIEFEEHLTIDELEDELREKQNEEYMEGIAVHSFNELTSILEYVPDGYELDEEDEAPTTASSSGTVLDDEFPDLDEEDEKLEKDETMRWDDDDEESDEESDEFDELAGGSESKASTVAPKKEKKEAKTKPATKKKNTTKKTVKKPAKAKAPAKSKATTKKKAPAKPKKKK